jgi:hypothetical protein
VKWRSVFGGACLAVFAATCTTALGAADQDLERAIELYNARDYMRACHVLQNLDPAALTDQQRTTRTDYLVRSWQAVKSQATAPQDPANAEAALIAANRARADRVQESQPPRAGVSEWRTPGPLYVRYPDNWAEIARRRERYGAPERMEDKTTRDQRQRFGQVVPQAGPAETSVSFGDAIERIRRGSGLNIVVNWPALQQFGITRDQEVSWLRLTNVTWRKVLELMLQQVSSSVGGATQLDWAIDGGVLTISTRDDLSANVTTRVYDVGDLLMPPLVVPQTTGFGLSGQTGGTGTGTGGVGGFGGGSSFGAGGIGTGVGGFGVGAAGGG